ncbi:MAG: PfkB family carbohydrate kinase [Candidatus Cyclobacteriaceae bacterium M3_2C_046]
MNTAKLQEHLQKFPLLKIAVIGDFALDFYYQLEKDTGEISIETGKVVHHGSEVRTLPGGAGNVVKNLLALQVGQVQSIGMVGDDIYGRELRHQLQKLKADTGCLLEMPDNFTTITYTKPHFEKTEENRIDFGNSNHYRDQDLDQLFRQLEERLSDLQAVVINQQFAHPLIIPDNISRLNDLIEKHPEVLFIGDLRDHGHLLRGAILKLNLAEAYRFLGRKDVIQNSEQVCHELVRAIFEKTDCKVLLTRGASGLSYFDGNTYYSQNGLLVDGPIDPVGAGDSCLSGFITALAAGLPVDEALELANIASVVTVKKVQETGTASPEEILALNQSSYPVYHPDLAADVRKARWLEPTDIEMVETLPPDPDFRHVIFDHDGTISTLREGWEEVMLPMMVESICGQAIDSISTLRYQKIMVRCRDFIDQSTGIQTIVQMQGLVEMVDREGLVAAGDIKTAEQYKAIYLEKLMLNVNRRIERFKNGERNLAEFTMKGAVEMLERLAALGLRIYLASGTDEDDVINEATILGYVHHFEGGIYGSRGNEIGDAKKKVIQRILAQTGASGDSILVLGDGPVEIREGRKAGAYCIGVASDEVRRYGLNASKRARLIKAGAHLVIPDFTNLAELTMIISGRANKMAGVY